MLRNAVDMVLTIDAQGVVADVSVTQASDQALVGIWTGRPLSDIISPESRGKVSMLLEADAGLPDAEVIWRHINLERSPSETVPLLMKFVHLPAKSQLSGVLMARDLRPTVELSERFRVATLEMESRYEALAHTDAALRGKRVQFDDVTFGAQAAGRIGATLLKSVVERIHESPMDAIIAETVRVLERLCISEALNATQGGEDAAARMLGISVDDLRRKFVN